MSGAVIQAAILMAAIAAALCEGEPKTDAKWLTWATGLKKGADRAGRWAHRPRLQRRAVQAAAVFLAAETALGLLTARGLTIGASILAGAALAAWTAAWAYQRARAHARVIGHVTLKDAARHAPAVIVQWWNHRRGYTVRLRDSAAAIFGVTPWQTKVAPDRSRVSIVPPYTFAGHEHERLAVASTIGSLMHREGLEPDWSSLHGRKPEIRFHLIEPPPGILYWDNIASRIAAVPDHELVTGIGHRGKLITASLSSDSPHLGIGMGTGAGKSNLAAFWLVQRLRRGDFALIVDGKRFSHPWAFKDMAAAYALLPNVAYVRSISDIHDALVWLGMELARRNEYVEQHVNAKGDILAARPRKVFGVLEELNYVIPQLKSYWARQYELLLALYKDGQIAEKPPKQSPALIALEAVAAAGRAVGIHLIFIGQRLDADVLGSSGSKGGAVRGNIGVRALARYDEQAWRLQAGGVPMPPSPSVDGRIQLWVGGQVYECQVPLMDHKEAISELRELALGGTVTPCPPGMPGGSQLSVRDDVIVLQAPGQPESVGQAPDPDKVTLRQAHDQFVFGPQKYDTISRYSRRPGFPDHVGWDGNAKVYRRADLYAWQARKEKVPA